MTDQGELAEIRVKTALAELAEALLALVRAVSASDSSTPVELLSPREFARRTGVSRSSVYLAIGRGDVRSIRLGGRRLIPSTELARLAGLDTPQGQR